MVDTVLKKSSDPFTSQARQHKTVAENIHQMIGQGETSHEALSASIAESSMSEAMPLYTEWWQSFKRQLSAHADQHEKLASNLGQTVNDFDETDDRIKQSFDHEEEMAGYSSGAKDIAGNKPSDSSVPDDMSDTEGPSGTTASSGKKRKISISKEPASKRVRNAYAVGQHGYKKKEQERLTDKYKKYDKHFKVTGDTHESEHAIGFEPINKTSGMKRGKTSRARRLENKAYAYQEVRELHRKHIGTGTHASADASGFTSETYRETQRSLLENKDVSSAVQLNQLGYAFDPEFKKATRTLKGQAANESYNAMAGNMETVTYARGTHDVDVTVSPIAQAEMKLAREAAQTGEWPTQARIDEVRKELGVPKGDESSGSGSSSGI